MNAYFDVIDDKDELLRRLNERYVVVGAWTAPRSSYARCLVFDIDYRRAMSFGELRKRYCNVRIETGQTIANWWLHHPDRRQVTVREELPDAE